LDIAPTVISITFESGFSGIFDAASYVFTTSGTITVNGSFTFRSEASVVHVCDLLSVAAGNTLTVYSSDVDTAFVYFQGDADIYGTVIGYNTAPNRTYFATRRGFVHIHATGAVNGYGFATSFTNIDNDSAYINNEGTIDVGYVAIYEPRNDAVIVFGDCTATFRTMLYGSSGTPACTLGAADITGQFYIRDYGTATLTVNYQAAAVITVSGGLNIQAVDGDVLLVGLKLSVATFVEALITATGSITWATGELTLNGTAAQSVDLDNLDGRGPDIVISKASGVASLQSDLTCSDVTLHTCSFNLNGYAVNCLDTLSDGTDTLIYFDDPGSWTTTLWTVTVATTTTISCNDVDTGLFGIWGPVDIYGEMEARDSAPYRVRLYVYYYGGRVRGSGSITGYLFQAYAVNFFGDSSVFLNEGTINNSLATLIYNPFSDAVITLGTITTTTYTGVYTIDNNASCVLGSATLSGDLRIYSTGAGDFDVDIDSGSVIAVTKALTFTATAGDVSVADLGSTTTVAGALTLTAVEGAIAITALELSVEGNIDALVTGGAGTIAWPTGQITCDGAASQAITAADATSLPDLVVDAADVSLADDIGITSLTLTSGDFDAAGYDVAVGDITITLTSGDTMDWGVTSNWYITGDVDTSGWGGFDWTNYAGCTFHFVGSTQSATLATGASVFGAVNVDGTDLTAVSAMWVGGDLYIAADASLTAGASINAGSDVNVWGTLTGALFVYTPVASKRFARLGGSSVVDPANFYIYSNTGTIVDPGVYGGNVRFAVGSVTRSFTFSAGTYTVDGDFQVDAPDGAGQLTIDMATNEPTLEIAGSFIQISSLGTIIWNRGNTSLVRFNGTSAETLEADSAWGRLDPVEVSGGVTVSLLDDLFCTSFKVTGGAGFTPGGYLVDVEGDVTFESTGAVSGTGTFAFQGDWHDANHTGSWLATGLTIRFQAAGFVTQTFTHADGRELAQLDIGTSGTSPTVQQIATTARLRLSTLHVWGIYVCGGSTPYDGTTLAGRATCNLRVSGAIIRGCTLSFEDLERGGGLIVADGATIQPRYFTVTNDDGTAVIPGLDAGLNVINYAVEQMMFRTTDPGNVQLNLAQSALRVQGDLVFRLEGTGSDNSFLANTSGALATLAVGGDFRVEATGTRSSSIDWSSDHDIALNLRGGLLKDYASIGPLTWTRSGDDLTLAGPAYAELQNLGLLPDTHITKGNKTTDVQRGWSFDGSAYVDIADDSTLTLSLDADWTISFWVDFDSLVGTDQQFLFHARKSGGDMYYCHVTESAEVPQQLVFWLAGGTDPDVSINYDLAWHPGYTGRPAHIVIRNTYGATAQTELIINDEIVASQVTGITTGGWGDPDDFALGGTRVPSAGIGGLKGSLFEFAKWSRALGDAEVADMYSGLRTPTELVDTSNRDFYIACDADNYTTAWKAITLTNNGSAASNNDYKILRQTQAITCFNLVPSTGTWDLYNRDVTVDTEDFVNDAGFQFVGSGMSGNVVTVAGDMAITGRPGTIIDWDAPNWWLLNVAGPIATASYTKARFSDASGGTTIDADDGTNDLDLTDINWLLPLVTDVDGRQSIGVVQPLTGSDYPLIANSPPSADVRYLLADLWLSFDDPYDYGAAATPFKPPFHIYYLYGFGNQPSTPPSGVSSPLHEREIVIRDANNRVVIDTAEVGHATTFSRQPWGDRLEVVGWEMRYAAIFLVVHTAWPDPPHHLVVPTDYEQHINPANAILDERTWQRRPKRVRSLTAVLDMVTEEPVEFVEGYNMDLTLGDETLVGRRITHQVLFNAESGNGAGIYPGCQPRSLFVTHVNNIQPTAAGDFYLTGTGCYWVRSDLNMKNYPQQRVGDATEALLRVGNDCGACCACSQFVATANYMNRVRDQYTKLGVDAEQTRDVYHENRNRWNAGKCCFDQHLLRLQMQTQVCPHVDVLGQFCNWTDECVGPLKMFFDFSGTPHVSIGGDPPRIPIGESVPNFTSCRGNTRMENRRSPRIMRCDLQGTWPILYYVFDEIEPYQHVWIRFRLLMENCGVTASLDPFTVTCCLRATIDDVPLNVPCGATTIQPTSSLSSSSWYSVGGNWTGFEICKQETLLCPPETDELYNPAKCFTRQQIYRQLE
jgi:hypothetical protein